MYILIDNYDSFTFNLYHYLGELGADVQVFRNDEITVDELFALQPEGIILSPGPCTPNEAGICIDVVKQAAVVGMPLFGVCLGHQSIGAAFGGTVERAPVAVHGKTNVISHNNGGVFEGLPEQFQATRYHSLTVSPNGLPNSLVVDAEYDGIIMGMHHADAPLFGVQFHPESIETLDLDERNDWMSASKNASTVGHRLLKNFLDKAQAINASGAVRHVQPA